MANPDEEKKERTKKKMKSWFKAEELSSIKFELGENGEEEADLYRLEFTKLTELNLQSNRLIDSQINYEFEYSINFKIDAPIDLLPSLPTCFCNWAFPEYLSNGFN